MAPATRTSLSTLSIRRRHRTRPSSVTRRTPRLVHSRRSPAPHLANPQDLAGLSRRRHAERHRRRSDGPLHLCHGQTSNELFAFSIDNQVTGNLTPLVSSPFGTGLFPVSITIDPRGKYLYVANYNSGTVSSFAIDQASGSLSSIAGTGGFASRHASYAASRSTRHLGSTSILPIPSATTFPPAN